MSYTKCVYHNCDNTSENVSMFRFPVHDPARLALWIRNSGNIFLDSLTNEELRRRYICAAHFLPTNIHKGHVRSRLVGPAVPILIELVEVGEDSNQTPKTADADVDIPSSPEVLKVKTPTRFYTRQINATVIENIQDGSSSSQSSLLKGSIDITSTQRMSRKCLFEGPRKRLSRKCLFEEKANDTPRTKRLKSTASALLKKNEAQRVQIHRLREKKNKQNLKVTLEQHEFRSDISKTIVLMQMREKNTKKKWTDKERNVCLSLYYKSPEAYVFLRRQGVVLAAPSTIKRWLSKSNCLPGLCPDVFKKIEKRFENASIKEKACVITFDEMSIMSNLEYSKKYDVIEGFEDLGGNHRSDKVAKYALVFLVRGLYGRWKFPIAYFLSGSNVKAEIVQLLLKAVINKLFDNGLLPKAVVCDQATTNQNAFKKLGVTSKSPYFFCNGRKLFALFDVPHLIKNVRNNFLFNDYVNDDEQMSFQDIVKTYEIDKCSNTSRCLTKLTDRHMNPNPFQKMTVSLATQIFSNSVAAAIQTTKNTAQLKTDTADATIKFVKIVNNMFDALNSKERYDSNPYKHAISKKSTYALNAIIEGKNMFENLQKISYKTCKDGKRKKILTRPPCFDGVVQSCEAVIQILNEECSDPTIKFIITRKLNQDVIENLFARFRQKGGWNKNPTAKLLRTIFRSNLVNSLIKLPTTKNCEDEEDKYIRMDTEENVSPLEIHEDSLETKTRFNISQTHALTSASPSAKNLPLVAVASTSRVETLGAEVTLEQCSITYFAGYLAHNLLKKNKCQACMKNLIKNVDLEDKNQILILSKSYDCTKDVKLKMPSDKLLRLVCLGLDCYNILFHDIVHCNKIKRKLKRGIVDYLKCEAPELLNLSCEEHVSSMIDHMILVKIHFDCRNIKTFLGGKAGKGQDKIRILKNK